MSAQAPPAEAVRDFAEDVRRDLALEPKQIQSKYLYNGLGSALFEAICRLPWYRITRAEGRLLARFSADMVSSLEDPITFVELGCGSGEKLAMLAESLRSRRKRVLVHLIDISPDALELSERTLGALEHVSVVGHRATYEEGLRHAARAAPGARHDARDLPRARTSATSIAPPPRSFSPASGGRLRPGDALLLGADLVKPESELLLAYDDPLGVTAAFNKNLLARMNTELLADFDLAAFAHRAVWNPVERRVEMHLVSLADQTVRIPRAGTTATFARGEWIWTESSYKYDADEVVRMGAEAGFRLHQQWIESDARFALTLFKAE